MPDVLVHSDDGSHIELTARPDAEGVLLCAFVTPPGVTLMLDVDSAIALSVALSVLVREALPEQPERSSTDGDAIQTR